MSWVVTQAVERLKSGDIRQAYQCIDWGVREKFFERWYGIKSVGPIPTHERGTDHNVYEPCGYLILDAVFRRIAPRSLAEQGAFLDVGCGLGRAMVVASAHPYSAVFGVEISEDLIAQARENLTRSRHRRRCLKVEVVASDAACFDVPDEVTTVFMYNPFGGAPMNAFMRNLHASVSRKVRAVTVVFVNPAHFQVLEFPWLQTKAVMRFPYPGSLDKDGLQRVDFYSVNENESGRPIAGS